MEEMQKQWAEFDQLGEAEVRQRLASGKVFGEQKERAAREWLDQLGRKDVEASNLANFDLARQANNLARQANKNAMIANIISALAVVIAIVALVFNK